MDGGADFENVINVFEKNNSDSLAIVYLAGYPYALNLYHKYRSEILKEFKFSDKISSTVEVFHKHLYSQYCQNPEQCDQIFLVGVHVRRTDYQVLLARDVKQDLVNENFFYHAMGLMVKNIGKLGKKGKIIFIQGVRKLVTQL